MAIKVLEGMLKRAYGEAKGHRLQREARKWADSQGYHLITISKEDIKTLLVHNYVAIRMGDLIKKEQAKFRKEQKDLADPSSPKRMKKAEAIRAVANTSQHVSVAKLRKDVDPVVDHIFQNFIEHYNSSIKEVHLLAHKRGNEIEILQNRNHAQKAKDTIIALLKSNSTENIFKNIMKEGSSELRQFSRRTQFIHTSRTVGQTIAEKLGSLEATAAGEAEALKIIEGILDRVEFQIEKSDKKDGRKIHITGKIGPSTINSPGEESTDWTHLKPLIEQELQAVFNSPEYIKNVGSRKSSQPIDERLAEYLANEEILKPAKRRKSIKATTFKPENPKSGKGSVGKKRVAKPKGKRVKTKKGIVLPIPQKNATTKQKSPASMPLNIMVLLNNQLPTIVQQNMRFPALENRTGRFASSVKVTDVATTAQGFPSIGYTYKTNPYQTFEPGYKQGDPDRDPRKLIDKSIREIAVQFAMGRFYTRRV